MTIGVRVHDMFKFPALLATLLKKKCANSEIAINVAKYMWEKTIVEANNNNNIYDRGCCSSSNLIIKYMKIA
jgi:hypothetical protein